MARVLLVHHSDALGGGTVSLLDVVTMLTTSGHEVVVCGPGHAVWLQSRVEALGASFVAVPARIPIFYHYNGSAGGQRKFLLFVRQLIPWFTERAKWQEFFRSEGAEVVLVNSGVLSPLASISRSLGLPTGCFVRETFPRGSVLTLWLRLLLSRLDYTFFLSQYDLETFNLDPNRATVIPDVLRPGSLKAVDKGEARTLLGLEGDGVFALYVGGAVWFKGLDTLLEAAEEIGQHCVQVLVVASEPLAVPDGTLKSAARRVLDRRNSRFQRRVAFYTRRLSARGMLAVVPPREDLSLAYSAADVVVFPSAVPHQARPVFESGSFSLPILLSDFSCTREYVEHGTNGLTFQAGDSHDLACRLRDMLDEQLRLRLGSANHKRYREERDFAHASEKLSRAVHAMRVAKQGAGTR